VYKVLLCLRYLQTRWLAMICIVSVMLGVATLIVVNSVMNGFSTKLRDRLHGLLSDIVIEAYDYDGFLDPKAKMARIMADPYLAKNIESMAPTLEIFAMLQYAYHDVPFTRSIRLIGIDPKSRAEVGGFSEFLTQPDRKAKPSFDLSPDAKARQAKNHVMDRKPTYFQELPTDPSAPPPPEPPPSKPHEPHGLIIGHAIAHFRDRTSGSEGQVKDIRALEPGDDVIITTVSGQKLSPVVDRFAVADYFRSEMSEYDSMYVFVPIDHLQKLRTMEDRVTSILVRLKNFDEAPVVVARLKTVLKNEPVEVQTWEQKQGALLAAIRVEKGILNILLFMIIGVAGFGILAIFTMIVAEKTRDIGILKALGASRFGVMQIFLGYGLLLGLVGCLLGTAMGLAITHNINEIESFIGGLTGQELFPRDIYYFDKIPTDVHPMGVLFVNIGAVLIAVAFSLLPAFRAASLNPVRALRYE